MRFVKNYYLHTIFLVSTLFGWKNKLDPNEQNIHKVEIEPNLEETKNKSIIKNCQSSYSPNCSMESTYSKYSKISLSFSKKYESDKITITKIDFNDQAKNREFYDDISRADESIESIHNHSIPYATFLNLLQKLTIIYFNSNDSISINFSSIEDKNKFCDELEKYLYILYQATESTSYFDHLRRPKQNISERGNSLLKDLFSLKTFKKDENNLNYEDLKNILFFPKEGFDLFKNNLLDIIRKNKEKLTST